MFNFPRYLETGLYKGFIDKAIQYLKNEYTLHDVNILPWNLYTNKDVHIHEAKSSQIKSSNLMKLSS